MEKDIDVCEVTEIIQDPTEDQMLRFGYFRGKKDTFQITEFGEIDTAFTYFDFPRKGSVVFECLERPEGCVCTKKLYYTNVYLSCRAYGFSQFAYFITYDYVHDSVEFEMPDWGGAASIAVSDLRNGNAKSYIGNYMHNNKLYTHVHKLKGYYYEAYVNDSVGLIYYKYGDNYVAKRF